MRYMLIKIFFFKILHFKRKAGFTLEAELPQN